MQFNTMARQFLYATVRIESDKPAGTESGTGFIFSQKSDDEDYLFIVASKQLCQSASEGRIGFTKKQGDGPDTGNRFDLSISDFDDAWITHPDPDVDVAVMPLVPILDYLFEEGVEIFFTWVSSESTLDDEKISSRDVIEDVVFYSYSVDWSDQNNYLPVIHQGITATPVFFDYCGKKSFLIDAPVLPGSSGSPVFLVEQEPFPKLNGIGFRKRLYLLGLMANPDDQKTNDLGLVYKASVISETCLQALKGLEAA